MRRECGVTRKLLLAGVVVLNCICFSAFSQETTKDNYTGSWTDDNSWVDGTAIGTTDLPTPGDFDITIQGYINVGSYGSNQDLTFAANHDAYDFTVNDTLVVYGNVDFANKAMNLVIGSGGLFIILGDLDMDNKIDIASDGNLVVQGTFNKTGSQGTYTGSGNVYAGAYTGDASTLVPDAQEKDTGSELLNDLPDVWEFLDGGGSVPLPVVLVYFKGVQVGNSVKLTWQTASERDNDYFTVEKSKDGVFFEPLGNIKGAGTTNQPQDYEFSDGNPLPGLSYYRLKQSDFDGQSETFRPIYVSFEITGSTAIVYPNPLINDELGITLPVPEANSEINMRIHDAKGRVVFEKNLITENSVNYMGKFNLEFLPQGYYLINLSSDKVNARIKLLRE